MNVWPSRLPPRYQPIWTIYIPIESPWLIDFKNGRLELNFWHYVMPCSATQRWLAFSGGITEWELSHKRITTRLKIFPSLLFYQFINIPFASHLSIYLWPNNLEKILNTSCFRSTFAVTIAVKNTMRQKISQGYFVLLLVTTLSKFQILWQLSPFL